MATADAEARGVGKALSLSDGVRGGAGGDCYISWPGRYQEQWNNVVGLVELLAQTGSQEACFSSACVFLPEGDANYGRHEPNTHDNDGHCWCHKLYGEPKEWGCRWFKQWQGQLRKAIDSGQNLVVVYKDGETGQGDEAAWANLPVRLAEDAKGLGASQRGEVAFAKELLDGRSFEKIDVEEAQAKLRASLSSSLGRALSRTGGGGLFKSAVQSCTRIRFGLRDLLLSEADIDLQDALDLGEALSFLGGLRELALERITVRSRSPLKALVSYCLGAKRSWGDALAESVAKLPGLHSLRLCHVDLHEAACSNLARSIACLPALQTLSLHSLPFGEAAGRHLAESIPQLHSLQHLDLHSLPFGEVAAQQLAQSVAHLPALQTLALCSLPLDEAAGRHLAKSIAQTPALQTLKLRSLPLGPAASRHLAQSIGRFAGLRTLELRGLPFGEAAGRQLAQSIARLPCLQTLDLCSLPFGAAAAGQVAQSMPKLSELRTLQLSSLPFRGEAGRLLAQALAQLTALRALELYRLPLGEDAGAQLAQSLARAPGLRDLQLYGLPLGEAAGRHLAESIASLPALEKLTLLRLGVGKAGNAKIEGVTKDRDIDKSISAA